MGSRQEPAVLAALGRVVRDHGWAVGGDPDRLRGMLTDVLGEAAGDHRGALDALVLASREGVPDILRSAGPTGRAVVEVDLVARLEEWGLTGELATWAVRAWADQVPAPTTPPPETAAPPPVPPSAPLVESASSTPTEVPASTPVVEVSAPEGAGRQPAVTALPDAPAESDAKSGAGSAPAVTALPVALTAQPAAPRDKASGSVPEQVVASPAPPVSPTGPGSRHGRRSLAVAAAAAVVLAGGGIAGAVALTRDDPQARGATGPTPSASPSAEASQSGDPGQGEEAPPEVPTASGQELLAVPAAVGAERVQGVLAMAARTGGVRVTGLSELDEVAAGPTQLARPEDGRLIAFRLADWPCDGSDCRSWSELGLSVRVGKDVRPLPDGRGTFVVAAPRRATDVDLVMRADGHRQTISLVRGRVGKDNIEVLARKDRRAAVDRGFELTDTLSSEVAWPSGTVSRYAARQVTIRSVELAYFVDGLPSPAVGKAYLLVDAWYTRPWSSTRSAFRLEEMGLRVGDTVLRPVDTSPDPEKVRPGFVVPADLERGVLVLGGSVALPTGGQTITQTLSPQEVTFRIR